MTWLANWTANCVYTLLLIGALIGAPTSARAGSLLSYSATGRPAEPITKDLTRVSGKSYGVSRQLRSQRLTLLVNDVQEDRLERWISTLLTVSEEARVTWVRSEGGARVLTPNLQWQRLAARLREADLAYYLEFLESEVAWLGGEGAALREAFRKGALDPEAPDQRIRHALMLESLGKEGRKRLVSGEAMVFPVSDLQGDVRVALERHLPKDTSGIPSPLPTRADPRCCIWLMMRAPGQVGGFSIVESAITRPGSLSRSGFMLTRQGTNPARAAAARFRPFRLPAADPSIRSRLVTVNLSPAMPGSRKPVARSLDQVLTSLSKEAKLNLVSDGYLRHQISVPPNLVAREYPLKQLLDRIAQTWDLDIRFADGAEDTVLIRSRAWFLEDEVDIPDEILIPLRDRISRNEAFGLDEVLALAELSNGQLHKLAECGILPNSLTLSTPGTYDDTGVRPLIRLFGRLSIADRRGAATPEGLPLKKVPAGLVKAYLTNTLLAYFGEITPELVDTMAIVYSETAPGSHRFALTVGNGSGVAVERTLSIGGAPVPP